MTITTSLRDCARFSFLYTLRDNLTDPNGNLQELRIFMDSILAIDQDLVTDSVRQYALTTIEAYKNRAEVKWNEAELGIYLVYIFGEINKSTWCHG